jgi:hypothetical protein
MASPTLAVPSLTRTRGWATSYLLMARYEVLSLRTEWSTVLIIQLLMGAGMIIMYGFFFEELGPTQIAYLVSGAPRSRSSPSGSSCCRPRAPTNAPKAPTTSRGHCRCYAAPPHCRASSPPPRHSLTVTAPTVLRGQLEGRTTRERSRSRPSSDAARSRTPLDPCARLGS